MAADTQLATQAAGRHAASLGGIIVHREGGSGSISVRAGGDDLRSDFCPPNPPDPVVSYVLNRGLAEPLLRMVKQFETVEILTSVEVKQLSRTPQGEFLIVCVDGRRTRVDDLGGIEFEGTRIAVHTDPIYAPKDPNHWSFLNCQIHRGYCEASMWLNKVLTTPPLPTEVKLWKNWVTHRDRQPAKVLPRVDLPAHGSNCRESSRTGQTA